MLAVSYYTPDGNYRAYAEKLRASCERFGIEHQIEELPSRGSWVKNIGRKAQFVYDKLMANKRAVVWLDVDCEVMEYPVLLDDERYDFMVYNWYAEPNPNQTFLDPSKLGCASGVFKVAYTAAGLQLIHKWIAACKDYPDERDDMVLDHVWQKWKGPKIKSLWLPKAYNRMDTRWPDVKPVINHVYTDGVIFRDASSAPVREKGVESPEAGMHGVSS
jgi:hypothetical protein